MSALERRSVTSSSTSISRLVSGAIHDAIADLRTTPINIHDQQTTRHYGDTWAQAQQSAALRVPSVVSTASYNYVLNPDHHEFEHVVKRTHLGPYQYDARLLTLLERARTNDSARP